MKKASLILILICMALPGLHAQALMRLRTQAYYRLTSLGTFDRDDSMRYTYRGWNGSRYDFNSLEYTPTQFGYPKAYFFSGDPYQAMTASNNIDSSFFLNVDYDTAVRIEYSFKAYDSYRTRTRGTGPTVSEFHKQGSGPLYNAIHLYLNGRLRRIIVLFRHPATLNTDTAIIRTFNYDANGRMILDSSASRAMYTGVMTEDISRRYVYGTGRGCLVMEQRTGPTPAHSFPRTELRIKYSYYPNGQVQRFTTEKLTYFKSRLYQSNIDSFAYTTGVPGHTYHSVSHFDTFGNQTFRNYTVNVRTTASGLKDSGLSFNSNDPANPVSAYAITYDASGYPLRRNNHVLLASGGYMNSYELYQYEPVLATAVTKPMKNEYRFSIYPNPTKGTLTINAPAYPSGASCVIAIHNAAGQLVYRESLRWPGTQHRIVLDEALAPGHYYLQIHKADRSMLYSQNIAKE